MNLFKQVRAVSRDDTLHTCLRIYLLRRRDRVCPQRVDMGERVFILAVRRMRREYIRTMSKNADGGCSLEGVSTFHPCFIDIFTVCSLKSCGDHITRRFCLSSVVSSAPGPFNFPKK